MESGALAPRAGGTLARRETRRALNIGSVERRWTRRRRFGKPWKSSSQITVAIVVDADGERPRDRAGRPRRLGSPHRVAPSQAVGAAADLGTDGSDVTRVEVERGGRSLRRPPRAMSPSERSPGRSRLPGSSSTTCGRARSRSSRRSSRRSGGRPGRRRRIQREEAHPPRCPRGHRRWAWRTFFGPSGPEERAGVSYADGSTVVLEPGSPGFDRLATIARSALRR